MPYERMSVNEKFLETRRQPATWTASQGRHAPRSATHPHLRRLSQQVHRVRQLRPLAHSTLLLDQRQSRLGLALLDRRRRRYAARPIRDRLLVQLASELPFPLRELSLDMRDDEIDRPLVVVAGNDDVGEAVRWLDEVVERGLDEAEVLVKHAIDVPPSLNKVSPQPPRKHEVRVALDEYPQVEQVTQVLVV